MGGTSSTELHKCRLKFAFRRHAFVNPTKRAICAPMHALSIDDFFSAQIVPGMTVERYATCSLAPPRAWRARRR